MNEKKPYFITFCSGKGGVGKSVMTANLGKKLSENSSVLIWDADMYFPNQHLIMGVEPPVRVNLVYEGKITCDRAIYGIASNFDLLADLPAAGKNERIDLNMLLNVYKQILDIKKYDYTLLDTPAGGINEILTCSKFSDIVCVFVTDEPTSLLDGYGLIKILVQYIEPDKIYIIVNNVIDFEDASEVTYKLNLASDKFLGVNLNLLGYIPYDRIVRQSIVQQELFTNSAPDAEVSKAIEKISMAVKELRQLSVEI